MDSNTLVTASRQSLFLIPAIERTVLQSVNDILSLFVGRLPEAVVL